MQRRIRYDKGLGRNLGVERENKGLDVVVDVDLPLSPFASLQPPKSRGRTAEKDLPPREANSGCPSTWSNGRGFSDTLHAFSSFHLPLDSAVVVAKTPMRWKEGGERVHDDEDDGRGRRRGDSFAYIIHRAAHGKTLHHVCYLRVEETHHCSHFSLPVETDVSPGGRVEEPDHQRVVDQDAVVVERGGGGQILARLLDDLHCRQTEKSLTHTDRGSPVSLNPLLPP